MLSTSPTYLRVRRPSPTTVEFIVSNAPSTNTITSQVFFYLSILVRVLLCVTTLIVLIAKAEYHSHLTSQEENIELLRFSLIPAAMLSPVDSTISWHTLIPGSLSILFLCFCRFHTGKPPPFTTSIFHSLWERCMF